MANRVVHFDFQASKPERLVKFYENVFRWKFKKWDNEAMDYWLVMTGDKKNPGIDGGLGKKGSGIVVNTIDVKNIDKSIAAVKANGGTIVMEKMDIPEVGFHATFKDPEGNLWGLMQMHPDAKMM